MRPQTESLAFSIPLNETFENWMRAHKRLNIKYFGNNYLTRKQLEDFCCQLSANNCIFKYQDEKLLFNSPQEFLKSLKNIGAQSSRQSYKFADLRKLVKEFSMVLRSITALLM